jgi:hypothetical protein
MHRRHNHLHARKPASSMPGKSLSWMPEQRANWMPGLLYVSWALVWGSEVLEAWKRFLASAQASSYSSYSSHARMANTVMSTLWASSRLV